MRTSGRPTDHRPDPPSARGADSPPPGAGASRRGVRAMSDKPGSVPPPLCKAILMCRSVGIDPTTGTYNLYGVLDGCELRALPGPTFPFTVFLSLTGSQGEQ